MATWSGAGGAVTVTGTDIAIGVAKWEVEETAVLANKTNSTSLGHKQRQMTIVDTTFSIEMPWDDNKDPAAIGINRGASVKMVLNKGLSGKKITTQNAIIEKVKFINDEDEDIVRLNITGYSQEIVVHS